MVLVSCRELLITVVFFMIVVLLTMTTEGRTGSANRAVCTKTNCGAALTKKAPRGGSGAHPTYPPPTRQVTQAGAHSVPGTQTHALTGS